MLFPMLLDVRSVKQDFGAHVTNANVSAPLSGSFMDYGVPRVDDFPRPGLDRQETLAPGNPFGVEAGGESGVRGAPAAVANAIVDALWHLGVRHVERPLTPSTVWETICAAKKEGAA